MMSSVRKVSRIGAVVSTPKAPGDVVTASWYMQHKGAPGRFWVGIGIFPHPSVGHANPSDAAFGPDIWLGGVVDIERHTEFTDVRFSATGPWPAGFVTGSYDVLKIIVPAGDDPVSRRERGEAPIYLKHPGLDDDWDDSVFQTTPPVFRFIEDASHPVVYT